MRRTRCRALCDAAGGARDGRRSLRQPQLGNLPRDRLELLVELGGIVGFARLPRRSATVEVAVAAYAGGHHPERDPARARGAAQWPEAVDEAGQNGRGVGRKREEKNVKEKGS